MLIKDGVWEGPFVELEYSEMGPRGCAGRVHMWKCPACGRHYYSSRDDWSSYEKEIDIERVQSKVLFLPTHKGGAVETRSGKHRVWPEVSGFVVAKWFRFVPAAFANAIQHTHAIATFKSPEFAYERTLIANEVEKLNVPQRVCPQCYAKQIKNDPQSVKIDSYFFRPTENPRIFSPNQPRVKQATFKDIRIFESTRVTPEDAKVLYRDYRWGGLGVLLVEGDAVELYERTFDGPHTARFENTKFVEFARVL